MGYLAHVSKTHANIDRLIDEKITRITLDQVTYLLCVTHRGRREKWLKMPFLGAFSYGLQKVLQPFGFGTNSINKIFSNVKDPIPRSEKNGVHHLSWSDCTSVYIDEVGRKVEER